MGFNIEATTMTAQFLKEHGIRTRVRKKLSEGSEEILDSIRAGYVSYVINTRAILSGVHYEDGAMIRRCAIENGITMLTNLDTVKVLLDVLEEQERKEFLEEMITPSLNQMFVTPKDVDDTVKRLSFTISEGLNIAFQEV